MELIILIGIFEDEMKIGKKNFLKAVKCCGGIIVTFFSQTKVQIM